MLFRDSQNDLQLSVLIKDIIEFSFDEGIFGIKERIISYRDI